jgi:predicted RNA-binding protein
LHIQKAVIYLPHQTNKNTEIMTTIIATVKTGNEVKLREVQKFNINSFGNKITFLSNGNITAFNRYEELSVEEQIKTLNKLTNNKRVFEFKEL